MTRRRCEPTDFKWLIIEPLLPNKPRGVARVDDRKVPNGIYRRLGPTLPTATGGSGRHSRPLWPLLLQSVRPVGQGRCPGPYIRRGVGSL